MKEKVLQSNRQMGQTVDRCVNELYDVALVSECPTNQISLKIKETRKKFTNPTLQSKENVSYFI